MYELNKQKFGAFVSALRKERGYTQKELAQKLFISDKAVSKWETGMSVPDVSLLVPLSELLGVSVTELLMCEKMEQPAQMDTCQVESLVKTAIAYADETPQRAYQSDRKKSLALCGVAGGWDTMDVPALEKRFPDGSGPPVRRVRRRIRSVLLFLCQDKTAVLLR